MATPFVLRRAFQAILPASLLLAACGKDDVPAPAPAVEQGKVVFVNAASHIAPTTLKFVVDNTEKASQAYGTASGYQGIATGNHSLQVTAGTQNAFTMTLAPQTDKNYTFVATPAAASSAVGGLLFTDDLTAPGTGKARIRIINLAQNVTTPIRLAQVTTTVNGPVVADVITNVALNAASSFTEFTPGTYNLSVLDNSGNTLAQVGEGNGAGTGTKKYDEGKIYTVVVSGTSGSLNQDQKLKAFLSQNN